MKIKQKQLIQLIEAVVRECLAARSQKQRKNKQIAEASYKVASDIQVDTSKEDKAREIQTDPKVNEASYKVASDIQVDTSKEDKARKIQTDPKVNETAFKKQGPSLRTFKDSPQLPDAVNDPENQ